MLTPTTILIPTKINYEKQCLKKYRTENYKGIWCYWSRNV